MIGDEVAREIERDPDLFYNHEKFRIWQAKARFRSLLTTLFVVPTLFTVANGGRNGIGLMGKRRGIATGTTIGVFVVSFWIWHRIVGYSNRAVNEQTYAKNVKMLRNLLIKQ